MRLINVSNVDTHLPSDIAITGQRGSCLHFLQSAFCRSLQQAWMAGALLLSSHWQLAQGVKAWSLRNSKLVHFLLSIYTKMLYSVAALLVCTLLLVVGLSIHRHWLNLWGLSLSQKHVMQGLIKIYCGAPTVQCLTSLMTLLCKHWCHQHQVKSFMLITFC